MIEGIFNILFVNPNSIMSGSEFSLLSLLENIDRKRFNPVLLLPEVGPFYNKVNEINIETITLPSMIRFGERYRISKLPRIATSLFSLMHIIKKKRIRLVHSNSPRASYLGGMAARLSSIPSVTHIRDIHLSPFSHSVKARLLGSLTDTIVAVSSATKNSILNVTSSLESKIVVIHNGVNIQRLDNRPIRDVRIEFGIPKNTRVIGSVGLIHPVKGHDILIKASALIKKFFPSIKVFIVGSTLLDGEKSFKNELDRLVKDLGLEENVIFTGFREDVFDFISAMEVMVHPATYPDPLPRILLEASALKKTIVATRVGGVPEIFVHNVSALLVKPSDPNSLANAVVSLLNDEEMAKRFALAARQKIEKSFNIEKHVAEMSAIYEKLLGGST